MIKEKFYFCEHCGKIVSVLKDSAAALMCCGTEMKELASAEAAEEKHVPVYEVMGGTVTVRVGETEHPMQPGHYIEWISIRTKEGSQIKYLTPGDKPTAVFALTPGDELEKVYAYCNLHGVWNAEVPAPEEEKETGNYIVCKCNNVRYFDVLEEIHKHSDIHGLLNVFQEVRDTTHCSTGCGGCYNKVLSIISDEINR